MTGITLKIETTDGGVKSTRSFSSINPASTNAELKNAAEVLTSLTDNTYSQSYKVTTLS